MTRTCLAHGGHPVQNRSANPCKWSADCGDIRCMRCHFWNLSTCVSVPPLTLIYVMRADINTDNAAYPPCACCNAASGAGGSPIGPRCRAGPGTPRRRCAGARCGAGGCGGLHHGRCGRCGRCLHRGVGRCNGGLAWRDICTGVSGGRIWAGLGWLCAAARGQRVQGDHRLDQGTRQAGLIFVQGDHRAGHVPAVFHRKGGVGHHILRGCIPENMGGLCNICTTDLQSLGENLVNLIAQKKNGMPYHRHAAELGTIRMAPGA